MEEQKKDNRKGFQRGSAFILAIVLTSLLAVIGVMFVMITRVDMIATSAIAENKALDGAIETIIVKISQQLILDTPGVDGQEYYDYPDANSDPWLASLEPYKDGSDYKWRRISDIDANNLEDNAEDVNAQIVDDYQSPSGIGDSNDTVLFPADADGDGVSDSVWIKLDGVMTTKGEPIYAAIRVIDNGGMLNVNTAYKFDSGESNSDRIDGSSQMQIDLMALSWRDGTTFYDPNDETYLLKERTNYPDSGLNYSDLDQYEEDVIWRYTDPNGPYTPFDIGDELELRYRYLINHPDIDTRLEPWGGEFRSSVLRTPVGAGELTEWYKRAYDTGNVDPNYAYRHIATTYNMDRIINPEGGRLVNVNTTDVNSLYSTVVKAFGFDINDPNDTNDPNFPYASETAAQLTVNLVDFRDDDPNVTTYDTGSDIYYGFERPCVYISELAHEFEGDTNDPNRSYAVELFKPYFEDDDPNENNWKLLIDGTTSYDVNWSGTRRFHVIYWENPNSPMDVNFFDANEPNDIDANSVYGYDPNVYDAPIPQTIDNDSNKIIFDVDSVVSLVRDVGGVDVVVDSVIVPEPNGTTGWLVIDGNDHSIQRDITLHKCIRRLWDTNSLSPTLGSANNYKNSDSIYIQAHPADSLFTNIGEIGKIFSKAAYYRSLSEEPNTIGYSIKTDAEAEVLINNTDPNFQQLFKYLTVFDPANDGINNDGDVISSSDSNDLIDEDDINRTPEWKVPGRININTAPWFVLAQLPWISEKGYGLAEEIVEKRDELEGFKNIGQLCSVVAGDPNDSIDYYSRNDGDAAGDQMGFPDLTGNDGAVDDFEERDLIFARISNLVTVRSDVFTAYILVRAGVDGAQKRVIAILDRSNVYPDSGDVIGDVKIRALHPVPDPR